MIEMGKKYQTRDGRAVRILAMDFRNYGGTSIVGIVSDPNDKTDHLVSWDMYGNSNNASVFDLIPVPTKHEGWMVFDTSSYALYTTKESTQKALRQDVGSQICDVVAHVTWED